METHHKPLVLLFSTKQLDEIPPRLQCTRTPEYDFTIFHVQGKDMHTADVLTWRIHHHDTDVGNTESNIGECEVLILDQLPASSELLDRIKTELLRNSTKARVVSYTKDKWPAKGTVPPSVPSIWKHHLGVDDSARPSHEEWTSCNTTEP